MGYHKIDKTDRKILNILQKSAKITNAQLSKEIGLSPAPTLERVKKLEQTGIIKSYHAQLDPAKIGLGVSTFVLVTLAGHNKENIDKFLDNINQIEEVIECHHITGSGDFILKVIAKDIASYQQVMLEKVSDISVVDNLSSMVVLSTLKDSKALPIPE
ncbi:Lrp/AsnC family transcriptional regulator [Aureibacter tunicatorum]|uniref:DNA-binding Lrp family transcriptional regulator n=1 Tax=Aureibacter tunicatorum TaxID=866807 RepID=A0AAE3XKM9_9BACT|nr:Lrp/AsnC family transcriptional regulator [Aureibacter tunicatorum]MDR6237675.1 DNA-binding Lrp family transcriptional regulator [Aureibacter tunicatorum]BDD02710.1 ArsR family transcriptional regulator [Aureibacter tunicatorum]